MIILVETNFVLELAFLQEEHQHCEAILELAKSRKDELELALPAFSVGEAHQKQIGQERERKRLHDLILAELNQLSRSKPYAERSRELQDITGFLVTSGGEERRRLESVLDELLSTATVVPLTASVIREASVLQSTHALSAQDALVYSSALQHLKSYARERTGPHCFITRNPADFANPDIESDLERLNCKILFRFETGLDYVRSRL